MKKILLNIMMFCAAVGFTTSCSNDYEDASSVHVYGEDENPPLKGSDANMPSAGLTMAQAEAGLQIESIKLSDYEATISQQLGMSLDEAIAALDNGSVRFLLANPARRIWDKTEANAGENKWALSASGIITDQEKAAVIVEFVPSTKEIKFQLTSNAVAGIIPVVAGFVKTDDSAYSTNFRCQSLITVTDASVVNVDVLVPKGDYACGYVAFADYAKNIDFAFGVTPYDLTVGIDTADPLYDAYLMDASGNLYGGPDSYTANGAGYWMTQAAEITTWGTEGFAIFIEPDIWDWEAENYYTDGGYLALGRLSSDTPASGSVVKLNYVLKSKKDTNKTLTFMFTITFE
ncbi:MAG: DUF4859 domain-containing protein [Bacteroides sp.]|nr:DUF4859 domain-containing protein [Bacteroides sp.]